MAIIKLFKTSFHYLKGFKYKIFALTLENYFNLNQDILVGLYQSIL